MHQLKVNCDMKSFLSGNGCKILESSYSTSGVYIVNFSKIPARLYITIPRLARFFQDVENQQCFCLNLKAAAVLQDNIHLNENPAR